MSDELIDPDELLAGMVLPDTFPRNKVTSLSQANRIIAALQFRIAELEHMVKDINEWEDEVERLDAALAEIENLHVATGVTKFTIEVAREIAKKARAGK